MKILITGAGGWLGMAMARGLSPRHETVAICRAELDVRDAGAVRAAVARHRPDAVVNCSAYTDVERAENEPVEALHVNALAVRSLASAADEAGAVLVHYSTDFVFDGCTTTPYSETDLPNPRSTYACSKLIGEWFAQEARRHYVLRVESLFGGRADAPGGRRTSVDRITDAIIAGEETRVFTDRVVSPSYATDVVEATQQLLERALPFGLYHCVNTGQCTFADIAREVAHRLGKPCRLVPISMKDAALRAQRPSFCALSNRRLAELGIVMPTWEDALGRYLLGRAGGAGAPVRLP